ncbi:hypothetical protein [Staphylococcus saprophyticus]|uniref:hypothetical protein n=1 Tax=Staphylococcus saprophyticus TaxID=29385 RepID=UPI000852F54C|nr:hypothetical protein [Staphylococcus saprophyticus]MDW3871230.1 hypothetical protein [Staphylococcus saprophyticus]MDW4026264.1 hypothetical protein [Staphylococcus saprophyticus]OEK40152.1 hypothetical protein ASS89_08665 [Staphylococcus saprophyticus]RIO33879.1 hypothetical protein BUZ74_04230 [Staphylococcus saprophyticus]
MAYKYEKENKEATMINPPKANKELKEVYRKAKAFDAIVDIEDDFVKYHGFYPCVEEYAEEVEEIISEYLERADDER